jgi:hypothetical protein
VLAFALEIVIRDPIGTATALATTSALANNIVRAENTLRANERPIAGRFRSQGIAAKVLGNDHM